MSSDPLPFHLIFLCRRPSIVAKILETSDVQSSPPSSTNVNSPTGSGKEDATFLQRFASIAGLSLRHTLALAIQLNRSPQAKLQHAGLQFLTQALAWSNLGSISQDNKNWANLSEDLLHDLSYLVTSHPAFPNEQKQSILQSLSKIAPVDAKREAKLREEAADLAVGISSHTNSGTMVADVLQDLGYSISSSVESLKEALHPFPKLTEQDVAR